MPSFKVPGHLIQHCPTNGDPSYDVRRVKPPTGIPKSMLMTTPDGSYALPSGAVAVLKPNEAAFEKEIEGMPSTRPVTDFPPELHCPLCKEVMKDAVLTSKCCFSSYCDKCIRDHIISKSMCVCGFTNIFADDLLPNKTLRETIRRIMESSTTSSAENAGSFVHVQDMESARPLPPKDSSPSLSATKDETAREVPKLAPLAPHSMMEVDVIADNKGKEAVVIAMTPDDNVNHVDPKPTPESVNIKMATSQESMPIPKENLEKMLLAEQGKKKKKKKIRPPVSSEMLWRGYQDSGLETFGPNGMPMQPSAYNPYMSNMSNMNNMAGMPWVMDGGYMAHFPAGPMPSIPYHHGPYDVPYGGMMPPDPFASQGFMMPPSMPIPPHRDLVGFNKNSVPPPMIGREDVGVRNADIRKRETHRNNESYHERFRDREYSRDNGSNAEKPSLKPKPKISLPLQTVMDQPSGRGKSPVRSSYDRDGRDRRNSPAPLPISNSRSRSKPKPVDVDESSTGGGERKYKPSVFSRISFPDPDKKSGGGKQQKSDSEPQKETGGHRRSERERRISSSSGGGAGGGEHFRRKSSYDHDSSEEEYHSKDGRPRPPRRRGMMVVWQVSGRMVISDPLGSRGSVKMTGLPSADDEEIRRVFFKHYTAALACSVESRPFAAICFCNRAAAYQALNQITDAIADCSLAIALDENYPKAISRRATLYELIRDYDQANNDLGRLISLLKKQSGAMVSPSSNGGILTHAHTRLSCVQDEARKGIPLNMYKILGVESSSTTVDIKKAYRKAALKSLKMKIIPPSRIEPVYTK